ncbi:MAG: hypothetical protein JEY96_19885 [Bacteroidales bacterium]|nr:hypothetical protein [Bacteroidales bacterium]
MRQKTISSFLMVVLIITGCSNEGKIKMTDCTHDENGENCIEKYVTMNKVDKTVKEVFNISIEFIGWYNSHVSELNQGALFTFSDSCNFYILDEKHANFYLNSFANTNMVSDNFIEKLREDFYSYDKWLKDEKLNIETDGVIGYEADLIYNNQDNNYYFDLNAIGLDEFILYENRIEIILKNPLLFISFIKDEKNNWVIDKLN